MSEANKDLVRRAWAAYDHGQEEAFAACLAPGWQEYDGSGAVVTLDDVRAVMRQQRDAFPDKQTEIEVEVAEGELVVTKTVTWATHLGRYHDLEPTRQRVRVTEISIHRISGGKIAQTWQETGTPGFYEQLTGRSAGPSAENMA